MVGLKVCSMCELNAKNWTLFSFQASANIFSKKRKKERKESISVEMKVGVMVS